MKHVSEGKPVFFYQYLEAFYLSVEREKHKLGKTAKLGSTIPSVRTMNQDVLLLYTDFLEHAIGGLQNFCQDLKPIGIINLQVPFLNVIQELGLNTYLVDLVNGLPYPVNVFNVTEFNFAISVVVFDIFKPSLVHFVCKSINVRSSIKYDHLLAWIWTCFAYLLQ